MRILLVSQYFWPETFSSINDLVRTLVAQGHFIQVLTGKPNYPQGEIFPGYTAAGYTKESFDAGVSVHRIPLRPRHTGARDLLLNYLSFVWNGLWFFPRAVRGQSFDLIFVYMPSPITAVIPAIALKWRLRVPLAVWVQDLWPESLSATGFIRARLLLRPVDWLVRGIYAFTDILLVPSEAFRAPIARYADAGKIVYYPNSYQDTSQQPTTRTEVPLEILSDMEGRFCLVFAGNLGRAQAVETLVKAAEILKKDLPQCRLMLVGSGSMLSWLEEQKVNKALDNLILAGRFSSSEMSQFFTRAAGLLVALKKEEIFIYTIPSKVQAYLAAGRPVIAALDGEGARIIAEAGAGLSCDAEDANGLARCIQELFHMSPEKRESLGKSGRKYFLEHFEMERQSRRLVEILESRIEKGKSKVEATGHD